MSSNVKVLLVDDNPMVLGMLKQALATLGQIATAGDAADALLKAVDDPPDLLVTDYRMPGMDGRQLIEKLRSRPATASFSAIILASKTDITERLSQQDPVDDFVEKPFFLKDATRRIKRVIDKIALEKMTKAVPSDGVTTKNATSTSPKVRSSTRCTDRRKAMKLFSRSCAGPAATSSSTLRVRPPKPPLSSIPRAC
jgi:CheY-like chemotaxis protein